MSAAGRRVVVEAAGRLHLGVLDLRGALGRRFGGIGTAAPAPTVLVSAVASDSLSVTGPDAVRAEAFARRLLDRHAPGAGAHVTVHRIIPAHAGLGSGTQLGLAVARAVARIHGIDLDATQLARAVGRARRSAVGTWTFAGGGLVVEGGRRAGDDRCGPLVARIPFPAAWRCVVAIPGDRLGLSGADEDAALADLPPPSEQEVERVAHLTLMGLLPAVAEDDLAGFGNALGQIQEITGRWFAPAQGGTFASGATTELIARMAEWGGTGVGQSSWGPAVYAFVAGESAARRLADRVARVIDAAGLVFDGRPGASGARVWRTDRDPGADGAVSDAGEQDAPVDDHADRIR